MGLLKLIFGEKVAKAVEDASNPDILFKSFIISRLTDDVEQDIDVDKAKYMAMRKKAWFYNDNGYDAVARTMFKESEEVLSSLKQTIINQDFLSTFKDRFILKTPNFTYWGRTKYVDIGNNMVIAEVNTDRYKQDVPPESVIIETKRMKKQNLLPKIWYVISKDNMYEEHLKSIADDPLLVGYYEKVIDDRTLSDTNRRGYDNSYTRAQYVVVGAIWGKDVEELDKYFGSV